MRYFIIIASILLFAPSAYGRIIHVPEDSLTIQAGINGTVDGDTVLVAAGTYTGDGNRDIRFLGKAIVVCSEKGPDFTIIDCEGGPGNNHRGFFLRGEETHDSKLEGFTVTGGYKDGFDNTGGGLFCYDSSPTISHCVFVGNYASWFGGGVGFQGASPIIRNCIIAGNFSTLGGGISGLTSSPTISNCTIVDNSAGSSGGGLYLSGTYSPVTNCILWGNSPQAVYIKEGDVSVTYSDVAGGWTGEGNIDADPRFEDPVNDDYHLQDGSPCIDAGDPLSRLDRDRTANDMGVYGGSGDLPTGVLGGIVSGTLTVENSPYVVSEPLVVEKGTLLSIEPGVTIQFHNRSGMEIYGLLRSRGTATEPITFTRLKSWDYSGGLAFRRAAGEFHRSTIEYGLAADGGGICCRASILNITECDFLSNRVHEGGSGGAIYCLNSEIVIDDCNFTGNIASWSGGGMFCEATHARINGCNFDDNQGYLGGGIACETGSIAVITGCMMKGNYAKFDGGGVFIYSCDSIKISNCVISDNVSDYGGGGLTNWWASMVMKNCVLCGNSASRYGGGIHNMSSHPIIINCTISENSSLDEGGGIFFWGEGASAINSIIRNNSPDEIHVLSGEPPITYSNVKGGWEGEGNIAIDPRFVPYPVRGFEYLLRHDSPCIDAGDPSIEDGLYDWHPHWPGWYSDGARSDMGAYGGQGNIDWMR